MLLIIKMNRSAANSHNSYTRSHLRVIVMVKQDVDEHTYPCDFVEIEENFVIFVVEKVADK